MGRHGRARHLILPASNTVPDGLDEPHLQTAQTQPVQCKCIADMHTKAWPEGQGC